MGTGAGAPFLCPAAVTKYHRLDGLSTTEFVSHRSGGSKAKVGVPAGSGSGESPVRVPDSYLPTPSSTAESRGEKQAPPWALVPFMRAPPSWSYLILITSLELHPLTPSRGGRVPTCTFWGDTSILSLTVASHSLLHILKHPATPLQFAAPLGEGRTAGGSALSVAEVPVLMCSPHWGLQPHTVP